MEAWRLNCYAFESYEEAAKWVEENKSMEMEGRKLTASMLEDTKFIIREVAEFEVNAIVSKEAERNSPVTYDGWNPNHHPAGRKDYP